MLLLYFEKLSKFVQLGLNFRISLNICARFKKKKLHSY